MTDTNPDQSGQTVDNTDWKAVAEKFQSDYDALKGEVDKMELNKNEVEQFQAFKQEFIANPEKTISTLRDRFGISEAQTPDDLGDLGVEDELHAGFDPFDKSQFNKAVESTAKSLLQKQISEMREEFAMQRMRDKLATEYGFTSRTDQDKFLDFVTKPRGEGDLDILMKVYQETQGVTNPEASQALSQITKSKNIPGTAGVAQGGSPPAPDEDAEVIAAVVKASKELNTF